MTLHRLRQPRWTRGRLLIGVALLAALLLATLHPFADRFMPLSRSEGAVAAPLSGSEITSELEAPGGPLDGWDDFAEQARSDWRVPGVVVAVVQGDRIVKLKGYGTLAADSDRPVSPDTLFSLASVSKAFTSYGVGLLADAGKLDWDAPVRAVLPEFTLADADASARATPRDLLSHRTGLPRHDKIWVNNPGLTGEELLRRLPHLRMTAPLRKRYQYNNLMYEVAGLVIARASGQPWERFMQEKVFWPLGMARTTTSLDAMLQDADHAEGHVDDGIARQLPFRRRDSIGPAGGVHSTGRDMAQWLRVHLNEGRLGERQLLSPARMAELHRAAIITGGEFTSDSADWGYAMGWRVGQYRKLTRIYHGGVLDGFTSRISLFPEHKLGIVVLANVEESPLPERFTRHLVDRLAAFDPVDWSGKSLLARDAQDQRRAAAIARLVTAPAPARQPDRPLESYAGAYGEAGYGALTVRVNGARLEAVFNAVVLPLEPMGGQVFLTRTDDDELNRIPFTFRVDPFGRVAAVDAPMEVRVAAIRFARAAPPELADPAVLQRLAGVYRNGLELWRLDLAGSRMTLTVDDGPPEALEPDFVLGFRMASDPAGRLDFVLDRSGRPAALRAHMVDGLYVMPRVPALAAYGGGLRRLSSNATPSSPSK